MAVDTSNIELGEGVLTLKGPSDADYVDVGGTQGAEISYAPEFKDIKVGQAFAPVKAVMTNEAGSLKVKLAESSMRNLIIALGLDPSTMGSSAGSDYIEFGGYTAAVYFSALYTVDQVDDPTKDFRFYFYRMRPVSGLVLPMSASEERVFEVEFTLFADSTQSYRLGKIEKDR